MKDQKTRKKHLFLNQPERVIAFFTSTYQLSGALHGEFVQADILDGFDDHFLAKRPPVTHSGMRQRLMESLPKNRQEEIETDQEKLKGYHFMATGVDTAKGNIQDTQKQYFRVTDQVPEPVWYWAALGSIIVSASLFVMGKRDWSIFVGQWPPTFLLFGLFHKILRPSIHSM